MRPDHESALTDIEKLLPKVAASAAEAAEAHAVERTAELKVLERVIELLSPQFDTLADIIVVRREEFSSEATPSLNRFCREDGTGKIGLLRLWGTRIYLLKGGRLLLVAREGFRETRRRRGTRPDRHEVWTATAVEATPIEALERIALIEMVLETVREQLDMSVGLSEDTVMSAAERTVKLLKLLDGMH